MSSSPVLDADTAPTPGAELSVTDVLRREPAARAPSVKTTRSAATKTAIWVIASGREYVMFFVYFAPYFGDRIN